MKGLKHCYNLTLGCSIISCAEGMLDFFNIRGETVENNMPSIVVLVLVLVLVGLINLGVCGYLNKYIKSLKVDEEVN